jgi:DNA-binding response OmpR family regulator
VAGSPRRSPAPARCWRSPLASRRRSRPRRRLEHVWDANLDPFSNIVSVAVARLRRKLGDPPLIDTVVGKGYRL